MTSAQLAGLHLGVYRLHWKDGSSSVASVGHDESGCYWFAPSNWLHTIRDGVPALPCYDWDNVERVQLIETQQRERMTAARLACWLVNACGKTEPCCECGADYPAADLIRGDIYCSKCREKTK